MLPIRQGLSHLANLLQRSLPLAGSMCAFSMSRSLGRTGRNTHPKVKVRQGNRNSEYYKAPICYAQSCRKFRVQTFRVHNPYEEWALFCKKMIAKTRLG